MLQILLIFCLTQGSTLQGQKIDFNASESIYENINLYYYAGPKFKNPVIIPLKNGLQLPEQHGFDVEKKSIFYFPGWGENATSGSSETIVSAYLEARIPNIVVVDYSKLIRNVNILSYVGSALNVTNIGQALGQFFKAYIPLKQPLELIILVSHSLGSQVMAETAKEYGLGEFPNLTGLDPAGPLFNLPGVDHLDAKHGKFVQIIHTDGGFFGDGRTIGTVDFFPNKGTRVQPGCDDNLFHLDSFCSHHRSFHFYAESIRNPKAFPAKRCDRTFLSNFCCCNNESVAYMGHNADTSIHGTHYLITNAQYPYGRGEEGIDFATSNNFLGL